ncbi:hypothetical protein [Streptomyces sp. cf124]|uniref:hypothetical protein n=1 Tax=Streptomyces sp. cf124 TaxID=1761903 RepID=UPI0015A633BB|nr:hypothetical protein [Streptomyces sp. cf124]
MAPRIRCVVLAREASSLRDLAAEQLQPLPSYTAQLGREPSLEGPDEVWCAGRVEPVSIGHRRLREAARTMSGAVNDLAEQRH